MCLQSHADVLSLLGVKLEDVQHSSYAHLEEDSLAAAAKLHDVAQLCRVQILLGHWAEEVDPSLVDSQNQLGWQQSNGVLNPLHSEEDRVSCRCECLFSSSTGSFKVAVVIAGCAT